MGKSQLSPEHHQQGASLWHEAGVKYFVLTSPCLGKRQTDPFHKATRPFAVNRGSFLISPEQLNEHEASAGIKCFAFSFQIAQRMPAIKHPHLSLNHYLYFIFDTYFPPSSSLACLANNTNHLEDTAVLLPLCKVSTYSIENLVHLWSKGRWSPRSAFEWKDVLIISDLCSCNQQLTLQMRASSTKTHSRITQVQTVCLQIQGKYAS